MSYFMHDVVFMFFLFAGTDKNPCKVRRKERQNQLKKERQAFGLPPPKKTRLEDGGGKRRACVH